MNETKVIWHPYPETSPKKEGFYLLTIEIPFLGMFIEPVERELRFAYWDGKGFFAMIKDGERITAWTFQPEPYKPEVKKMENRIDFTDFDIDDDKTYPKREGSYLVVNELGSFHLAFWTEIKEINFGSETHIVKRPHWVLELWGGQIIRYSTTPLTDLDW